MLTTSQCTLNIKKCVIMLVEDMYFCYWFSLFKLHYCFERKLIMLLRWVTCFLFSFSTLQNKRRSGESIRSRKHVHQLLSATQLILVSLMWFQKKVRPVADVVLGWQQEHQHWCVSLTEVKPLCLGHCCPIRTPLQWINCYT